eukprot:357050-Chlamydomonas_euryale.AAC.1
MGVAGAHTRSQVAPLAQAVWVRNMGIAGAHTRSQVAPLAHEVWVKNMGVAALTPARRWQYSRRKCGLGIWALLALTPAR